MYCFLECEGAKNANSVCSFLYDFISKKLSSNPSYKTIIFLSDSAGGQNKNLQIVRFCTWLAEILKVDIIHIFPVRGHSYCQCDRNFGIYGSILRRVGVVESHFKYIEIMKEARQNPKPFEAEMSSHLLEDWFTELNSNYQKSPKLKNHKFSIKKYVKLQYSRNNEVLAYTGYNSAYLRFTN